MQDSSLQQCDQYMLYQSLYMYQSLSDTMVKIQLVSQSFGYMRNEWPHSFDYFYPHVFELIIQTLSNPDKRLKNGQVKGNIGVTRFRRKYYFYSGSSFIQFNLPVKIINC